MEELQNYEIDLNLIKPKNVKKSDKYSKLIYKYLKDNPWYCKFRLTGALIPESAVHLF